MKIDFDQYQVISFDIFDTILLRTVAKPIDVFEIVWMKAKEKGLAGTDISPAEFAKVRIEMERLARNRACNRECTMEDIYREFPDFISFQIEELRKLELLCEKECCYLNGEIYDLLRTAAETGKKVVLTSDMYFCKEQIEEILADAGFDLSLPDHIIVSNEFKCSKQTGELFDILFKCYPDFEPGQFLHIGDNQNGDYMQPIRKGMAAIHYDAVPEKMHSIYDYEKIRHNIPQKELLSLRKITVYNKDKELWTEEEKASYEIGASIMGPFLTMYASHVCDRLEQLQIHRIYPLMREGYILGKLLENEAKDRQMELLVKPIYVSRKVTYIPSIDKINREEIENMIGARNLTVEESIALVGLKNSDIEVDERYLQAAWKETHKISCRGSNLKEHLILQFLREENKEKIEAYVKEQRKLLIQYLIQEIGDFNEIATMDIGFFGRIQMWMEKALELEGIRKKMKHFLGIGITGDKLFQGLDFEGYYSTISENQDLVPTIHRTTDIIEKFISVTEGSTIGYCRKDGKIIPIKAQKVDNDPITDKSFEGILDFQKNYLEFRHRKPEAAKKAAANRRESLMIIHRLIDMPRLCEAKLIGGIEADTNFGTNYRKSIITKENLRLLEEKGIPYIDKCNASYTYENSNIVWPKGLITLKDEFYYVRRAMKNSTSNDILKSMQEVVEQVQSDGTKEIALYGAGENGRQFYFICQLYGIKVNCFIDRKESLWGTRKEGIEIMGLREAMEKGNDHFIVTSLFSISEIREFIIESFAETGRQPTIYSV